MYRYRAISALFIACSLVTGLACSSAPTQPEQAPDAAQDIDRSDWSDERRAIDDELQRFLAAPDELNEAFQQGPAQLNEAAEQKAASQQELKLQIRSAIDDPDAQPELMAWGRYRIAQTYLNFGCQLQAMGDPDDVPAESHPEYRLAVNDLSAPLFEESRQQFASVRDLGAPIWSDRAAQIVDQLPEEQLDDGGDNGEPNSLREICDTTADYWQSEHSERTDRARQNEEQEKEESPDDDPVPAQGPLDDLFDDADHRESILRELSETDESEIDRPGAETGLRGSGSHEGYGRIDGLGADNDVETTAFIPASQLISVDIDDPVVGESCTPDDIADTIDARHDAIQYCYERQVQGDLELSGEFALHFAVEPTGAPVSVEIVESSFDDSAVEDCVLRIAERLQFSERDGKNSCSVEISMSFSRDLSFLDDNEQ